MHLLLSKGEKTELAMLKLQRRKDLFEKVFDRSLTTGTG